MAIRGEDWTKITDAINNASNALEMRLRPKGWRKALSLARELSVVSVAVSTIVALGSLALTQWSAANQRLAKEASFETHTNDRLDAIEKSLLDLRAHLAADQPNLPKNQEAAKQVIADARKASIQLPASTLQQIGTSFVEASRQDPKAWDVALDIANYRTLLNLAAVPLGATSVAPTTKEHKDGSELVTVAGSGMLFDIVFGGGQPPLLSFVGFGSVTNQEASAARLEAIHPIIRITPGTSCRYLVLTGGTIVIDNLRMEHVVMRGVEVHYSGSPTIINDVLFANCRFVFENNNNTRTLLSSVIASTKINLSL